MIQNKGSSPMAKACSNTRKTREAARSIWKKASEASLGREGSEEVLWERWHLN